MPIIQSTCPCDLDGFCPYDAEFIEDCYYHCSVDEDTEGGEQNGSEAP